MTDGSTEEGRNAPDLSNGVLDTTTTKSQCLLTKTTISKVLVPFKCVKERLVAADTSKKEKQKK